jgi:hypothetical protein
MIFIKNCTEKEFRMEFKRDHNEDYKIVKKRKYNSEKIELKNELKSAFFVSEIESEKSIEFYEVESEFYESEIESENSIEFYEVESEDIKEFKSKEFISDESEIESEVDEDIDMDIDPDIDMRSDGSDYYYDDSYSLGYEDECYECFEI